MAQTLSADEFADLQAQLSKDFAWLLPRESGRRDPPLEVLLEVLLDWVADASGAPVLRDQGSEQPAGHGKADPSRDPLHGHRRSCGLITAGCGGGTADLVGR